VSEAIANVNLIAQDRHGLPIHPGLLNIHAMHLDLDRAIGKKKIALR
jgi:hypothetical protein